MEEAVEIIMNATVRVRGEENVIIAGDLNCQLDIPSSKTEIVLDALRDESFILINKKDLLMYIAPYGASAIDVVLVRGKGIRVKKQKGLWSSTISPIRKHIPIVTDLILYTQSTHKKEEKITISRKLNVEKIRESRDELEEARRLAKKGESDLALSSALKILHGASICNHRRKAQQWFDKECYSLRKETLNLLYKAKNSKLHTDLEIYAKTRKAYKSLLRNKRADYMEKEARRTAEDARKDPFVALKRRHMPNAGGIAMDRWENHFLEVVEEEKIDGKAEVECEVSTDVDWVCQACDIDYHNEYNFRQHLHIHVKERPFVCDICNRSFSYKHHIYKHMHTHTGERPYTCDICKKSFSHRSNLCEHMNTHSTSRRFHCNICNKSFSQKGNLNIHERIHSGRRPYSCMVCSKSFSDKSALNRHIRIHSGASPYSCEACNKTFSQKANLDRHIRVHLGRRPFQCDVCQKSFSQKIILTKHMLLHSVTSHACKVCNKSFPQKRSLNNHIRIHSAKQTMNL
ncbi:hypothetical protein C0J52_18131 [Blattella germanica]|nr:hypothetical protein C0J52_18131 [Blattella germanica]